MKLWGYTSIYAICNSVNMVRTSSVFNYELWLRFFFPFLIWNRTRKKVSKHSQWDEKNKWKEEVEDNHIPSLPIVNWLIFCIKCSCFLNLLCLRWRTSSCPQLLQITFYKLYPLKIVISIFAEWTICLIKKISMIVTKTWLALPVKKHIHTQRSYTSVLLGQLS